MTDLKDMPPPPVSYEEWKRTYDPNRWREDRIAVTADVVLFVVIEKTLSVLLTRRAEWPDYGNWVLPGGFRRRAEVVEDTTRRILQEKVGIGPVQRLEGVKFYDAPDRDERDEIMSIAFVALCPPTQATEATNGGKWVAAAINGDKLQLDDEYISLGFDHGSIVADACDFARRQMLADPLWIVPALSDDGTFTIAQLNAPRIALGIGMTEDALRRRVAKDHRVSTEGWVDTGTSKPSRQYAVSL
ncbi:NUDIX domain-containing protein [Gordonia hongkongensis]|uniref:NUDIX domain-containing protein n=1 Tax=Gordonia hongkongensis TaxID=1701090 RepID=UPI003EB7874A